MKHLLLLVFAVSVLGCKNTSKNNAETSDNLSTIQGNYIFFENAAVLQNDAEIYGVFLNEKAAQFKVTDTDMVSVEVKGIVSTKDDPKILWENKLEIVEIISVSAVKETENILKLGTE